MKNKVSTDKQQGSAQRCLLLHNFPLCKSDLFDIGKHVALLHEPRHSFLPPAVPAGQVLHIEATLTERDNIIAILMCDEHEILKKEMAHILFDCFTETWACLLGCKDLKFGRPVFKSRQIRLDVQHGLRPCCLKKGCLQPHFDQKHQKPFKSQSLQLAHPITSPPIVSLGGSAALEALSSSTWRHGKSRENSGKNEKWSNILSAWPFDGTWQDGY